MGTRDLGRRAAAEQLQAHLDLFPEERELRIAAPRQEEEQMVLAGRF